MSKTDGTNIFQYLYDNDRAVAEYNGTGTLLRKYIYGPGLDEPIMMIVPGDPSETVYYYHADHLGSVIGLTNDARCLGGKIRLHIIWKTGSTEYRWKSVYVHG
jgi:hypothetical protein